MGEIDELPDEPPSVRVEIRCPEPRYWDGSCHPGKLFAVLHAAGQQPSYVHPENLIEMACAECKKRCLADGHPVKRVLHRYSFMGVLVETLEEV